MDGWMRALIKTFPPGIEVNHRASTHLAEHIQEEGVALKITKDIESRDTLTLNLVLSMGHDYHSYCDSTTRGMAWPETRLSLLAS
jgi:hypothetical protein